MSVQCIACGKMTRLSDAVMDLDGPAFQAYYCAKDRPAGDVGQCDRNGCTRCAIRGWYEDDSGSGDGGGSVWRVCPTCKGEGSFPNPEGPERFDIVHTDGYALRHEWI